MPKKNINTEEVLIDLLQKLVIIELGKKGVPQNEIKKLLGVGIDKVNSILKYYNKKDVKNGK
jgi:hypothetical protein